MDPQYTFSVSKYQTAAGSSDIMSHTFENYFNNTKGAFLQARIAEGILKTIIKYAPIAVEHPDDYEARANLMWASSLAINGLIRYGEDTAWTVHPMEHELSAFYDITHGAGLALLTPYWMEYILSEKTVGKFAEYGVNVWGIDSSKEPMAIAKEAIAKTREFFNMIGMPSHLKELGIDQTHFDIMSEKAANGGLAYGFVPLTKKDVKKIYVMAL
jgi:alcohol dehydrogenase YqhD (iron-dependent ADH family)